MTSVLPSSTREPGATPQPVEVSCGAGEKAAAVVTSVSMGKVRTGSARRRRPAAETALNYAVHADVAALSAGSAAAAAAAEKEARGRIYNQRPVLSLPFQLRACWGKRGMLSSASLLSIGRRSGPIDVQDERVKA